NQFAWNAYLKRYLSSHLGLRLGYTSGRLAGNDLNLDVRSERRANFSTPLQELSFRIDLDAMGEGEINRPGFVPNIFLGAAYSWFNPTTDYGQYESADFAEAWVRSDQQSLASQGAFSMPMGVGLKHNFKGGWHIGMEIGYRLTFTDFLDGISETGDPGNNDSYVFYGLNLAKSLSFQRDSDQDGIPNSEDQCPLDSGAVVMGGCPDSDQDGVADKNDPCPYVAGLIELSGCPDADRDGITDGEDACPRSAGLAEYQGCPDSDQDGIIDPEDACPFQAGLAEFQGCADTDGDGFIDNEDACPNEAGITENNGCPDRDQDGDGVVDRLDGCPDEAGLEAFRGCPDTDGDGVPDLTDKCPDTAGELDNYGCPEIKEEDQQVLEFAVQNVNFESGRAKITRASFKVLNQIAELMGKYPDYSLKIDGHTDSRGDDDNNQRLSENRAQACLDYLVEKGIDAERITAEGFGEKEPIADNKTGRGRSLNRRVEFDLYLK
ncbi:MAG: DUF6089 family protein, partial [Bacteroidota bacterium]